MLKRTLGNTGYEIAPVVYGGIVSMSDGQTASDQYVSYAIEHGINYFDVAPSYGDAQEKLGNSLFPYRKSIYLACKTGERRGESAQRELEESFRLLKTDYFDNYQLHGLASFADIETAFGPNGAMETLVRAKERGLTNDMHDNPHNAETMRLLKLFSDKGIRANEGNNIFPSGNALKYLAEWFSPPDKIDLSVPCGSSPYTSRLDAISCFGIDPNGDVNLCSITIGNIYRQDILDIIDGYNPYKTLSTKALLNGGVAELLSYAKTLGVAADISDCRSACGVCRKTMAAIKDIIEDV